MCLGMEPETYNKKVNKTKTHVSKDQKKENLDMHQVQEARHTFIVYIWTIE